MTLGPVQVIAVQFDNIERLHGRVLDAIDELTPLGAARIIDALFVAQDTHGDLVVPFDASPAACWWLGGKTIDEVLDDLDAPEDTRCRYRYKH